MDYSVDYFINKFENIPEDKWWTGSFRNDKDTKQCAYGHCLDNGAGEYHGLVSFATENNINIAYINDMDYPPIYTGLKYYQSTPKKRVLEALYDIKAKEEPKEIEIKGEFKAVGFTSVVKKYLNSVS